MAGHITPFDVESQNQPQNSVSTWLRTRFPAWRHHAQLGWFRSYFKRELDVSQTQLLNKRIEDYPQGYPQYSSLIGAHHAFSVSRRFTMVRARLMLERQDRVTCLEKALEDLDANEERPLFLGSIRRDQNAERRILLKELNDALAAYDELLNRNSTALKYDSPNKRHISSLINWLTANGSICPMETSYLYEEDLCTIGSPHDDGMSAIESVVEYILIWISRSFQTLPSPRISRNKHIFIFTGLKLRILTRFFTGWLMVFLLILPVAVVHAINSATLQMVCVALSSGLFVLILSGVMNARAVDIFVAGPTYAALLAVFVSGGKFSSS